MLGARVERRGMARKATGRPTDLELEILNVLWERGPSTVADVQQALSRRRPVARTTVLTMLRIMTDKRLVVRDTRERAYRYRARESRSAVARRLVGDLLRRVLHGSAPQLVLHALEQRRLTPGELAEIRRAVEDLEQRPHA